VERKEAVAFVFLFVIPEGNLLFAGRTTKASAQPKQLRTRVVLWHYGQEADSLRE
jgi:hypothetical protein